MDINAVDYYFCVYDGLFKLGIRRKAFYEIEISVF